MRAICLTFLVVSSSLSLGALQDKLTVPDAAEQKEAESEIRSVFKEDFARKDRDGKRALAQKLLVQAEDKANTAAARYSALCLARDTSAEALDFKTGFSAIEALERLYAIRPSPITGATFTVNLNLYKASFLLGARKFAPAPEEVSIIAGAFMVLAEETLARGEYDDAGSFAELVAKSSKDPFVVGKAKQISQEVPSLKAERDAAAKAEATLAASADDTAAHATLGRYLLFVKKDEPAALDHLSKGPASPLRDLAQKELANPATPEAMLEVGEGWLALSDKEKGPTAKLRFQARALLWLERGFKNAGGLTKAKFKKRLAELGQIEEPATQELVGRWFFDEGSGTQAADSSGKENHGTLMNSVRWVAGPSGTAVSFDGSSSYVSCLASGFPFADTPQTITWAHHASTAPKGSAFVIALTSEKTSLILGLGYRDGKVAIWKTDMTLVQAAPPQPGEWHYFAYTYDRRSHKLYVDGALKATSTLGTMAGQYRMVEFGRWYGGYPVPDGKPDQFFQGSLDDVRIYNRALEEAEVRDLVRAKRR